MTPKASLVEKRIERFVKIFQAFFEHDKLYTASLSDKLSVQIRTIQRSDETEEAILNRLEVYNKQTSPLIEYYANKGMLKSASKLKLDELVQEVLASLKN